jgi:hypothetical protein
MALFAISGKARSGKDAFAEMLAEELNKLAYPPYVLMAFATELKRRCQDAFGLSWEQLWGNEKETPDKRYPLSSSDGYWCGRTIMQEFGEWYRTVDNEYWTRILFDVIKEKDYKNVIITDLRYKSEASYITRHGGLLIRINRDGRDVITNSTHASETGLDDYKFDVEVSNDGTLEDLRRSAKDVLDILSNTLIKYK